MITYNQKEMESSGVHSVRKTAGTGQQTDKPGAAFGTLRKQTLCRMDSEKHTVLYAFDVSVYLDGFLKAYSIICRRDI